MFHCHHESEVRQKPKFVKIHGLPIRIVIVQRRCNRRVMIRPIHNDKIRIPLSRRRRIVYSTMPASNDAPPALVLVIRDACQMLFRGEPTSHSSRSSASAPSKSDVAPLGRRILGNKLGLAPVYHYLLSAAKPLKSSSIHPRQEFYTWPYRDSDYARRLMERSAPQ